jgi:hypothetical protein
MYVELARFPVFNLPLSRFVVEMSLPHWLQEFDPWNTWEGEFPSEHEKRLVYFQLCRNKLEAHGWSSIAKSLWLTGPDGAVRADIATLAELERTLGDPEQPQSTICGLSAVMNTSMRWTLQFRMWILRFRMLILLFWKWILQFNRWFFRRSWTAPSTIIIDAVTIDAVILEIFHVKWPDFYVQIERALQQTQISDALGWQPQLPSQSLTKDKTSDLETKWMHKAPALDKYLGFYDWSLYVNEPFAEWPVMDKVRVIEVPRTDSDSRRIAMLASSEQLLTRIRAQYGKAIEGVSAQEVLDCQLQTLLCAVLRKATDDTTTYIEEITKRVNTIVSIASSTHCVY